MTSLIFNMTYGHVLIFIELTWTSVNFMDESTIFGFSYKQGTILLLGCPPSLYLFMYCFSLF